MAIKVLLENKNKWVVNEEQNECNFDMLSQIKVKKSTKDPILVVAYTNHALDQFLCHLLDFTKEIVRIGGRCKDEKIKAYMLRNLRKKTQYKMPKCFWQLKERSIELGKRLNKMKDNLFKRTNLDIKSFLKAFTQEFQLKFKSELENYFSKANLFFEKPLDIKTCENLFDIWRNSESITFEKFKQIRLYERNTNKNNLVNPPKIIEIAPLQNKENPLHSIMKLQENLDDLVSEESEEIEDEDYVENKRLENDFDDFELDPDEVSKKDYYFCYLSEEERENLAYFEFYGDTNIWDLNYRERDMLFKYAFSFNQKRSIQVYESTIEEFVELKDEIEMGFLGKDIAILKECEIVGMTVIQVL